MIYKLLSKNKTEELGFTRETVLEKLMKIDLNSVNSENLTPLNYVELYNVSQNLGLTDLDINLLEALRLEQQISGLNGGENIEKLKSVLLNNSLEEKKG